MQKNTTTQGPSARHHNIIHGHSAGGFRSPEYRIWCGMNARCTQASKQNFHLYGARGIRVCDRWRNSFDNFLADMGERPTPQHSLDRKDVNGNYEPDNCKWSTPKEQGRNRRWNHSVTYAGTTMTVAEWAEIWDVDPHRLYCRFARGWSVNRAFETPIREYAYKS